jgi:hypothetical protein
MATKTRLGSVIFTGDKERLAQFYEAVTGLHDASQDDDITVLAAVSFELLIHTLRGESGRAARAGGVREAILSGHVPVRGAKAGGGLWRPGKSGQRRMGGPRLEGM